MAYRSFKCHNSTQNVTFTTFLHPTNVLHEGFLPTIFGAQTLESLRANLDISRLATPSLPYLNISKPRPHSHSTVNVELSWILIHRIKKSR